MKNHYYVNNCVNGKHYGPFNFFKTATVVADKIDSMYGEVVSQIKERVTCQLPKTVRRELH